MRKFLIERRGADAAVNNLHYARRVFYRYACLAQNFAGDAGLVFGNDTARVHHFEVAAFPVGGAVDAVARDAGLVGDDRAARAGEAIEQRGLTHVGASDDHDGWKIARDHLHMRAAAAC